MAKNIRVPFLAKKRGEEGGKGREGRMEGPCSQTHTGGVLVLVFAFGRVGTANGQVIGKKSDEGRLVRKAIFGHEVPGRGREGEEGGKEGGKEQLSVIL
eukprot:evm.model.NODE_31977_length_99932_cov_29.870142.3